MGVRVALALRDTPGNFGSLCRIPFPFILLSSGERERERRGPDRFSGALDTVLVAGQPQIILITNPVDLSRLVFESHPLILILIQLTNCNRAFDTLNFEKRDRTFRNNGYMDRGSVGLQSSPTFPYKLIKTNPSVRQPSNTTT